MPYRVIEEESLADTALEITAADLKTLFSEAGKALEDQLCPLEEIREQETKSLELKAGSPEGLLHQFLEELVFLKDAEELLFSGFDAEVGEKNGEWVARVECRGERIDRNRHSLGEDVKAVTWHAFSVKKDRAGWKAKVVLDI